MATIGLQISGTGITTQYVTPDKSLSRQVKPNVQTADFGDGYQQRISYGLNSLAETFSVSFANRAKDEADDITKFFELKKGVTAFTFGYPDENASTTDSSGNKVTEIKVVCDNWSTTFVSTEAYSITASFRKVYEP
ncbi:MAG: hypothetical protein CL489_03665 [Acidobacteria bacterium]|nr:hypothetical protein [Acidobacteriota bacterium]